MREAYYYLIASLPLLEFGMKTPFTYAHFLSICEEQLSPGDLDIIKEIKLVSLESPDSRCLTLREWNKFNMTLVNEIIRVRANKQGKDVSKYILGEDSTDLFMAGFALWVVDQDSPLEAEVSLDRLRWEKLDDLGKAHYFDIDYLVTYALKLQILIRWDQINSSDGMQVLQDLITAA